MTMNLQEIDRLFDKHGGEHPRIEVPIMFRLGFAAAIQEATAQASQGQVNELVAALKECREYGYALHDALVEMIDKALAAAPKGAK